MLKNKDFAKDGIIEIMQSAKKYNSPDFEEVAGMVKYIRGETLFKKVLRNAGLNPDSKTTEKNIKKFMEVTKKL